ncbi:MAG: hypothetical protein FWE36_02370 [Erysipelotrichales bacterium]|nr:hypothetical protein [Erysipelotrichales bacterium]
MKHIIKLFGIIALVATIANITGCRSASAEMQKIKALYEEHGYVVTKGEFNDYIHLGVKGAAVIGEANSLSSATVYEFSDETKAKDMRKTLDKLGTVEINGRYAIVTMSGNHKEMSDIFHRALK